MVHALPKRKVVSSILVVGFFGKIITLGVIKWLSGKVGREVREVIKKPI